MKERPIIFSAESVRAILDGRKTQTRRIVRPSTIARLGSSAGGLDCELHHCPHGAPGDRLWVRETWQKSDPFEDTHIPVTRLGGHGPSGICDSRPIEWRAVYWADGEIGEHPEHPEWGKWLWKSPMFMPRWASRILLEITDVRVQRLQDISEEDAKAEGVGGHVGGQGPVSRAELQADPGFWHPRFYRDGFEWAWSKLHDKPAEFGASWKSNPWVWAISFKRLRP